MSSQKVYPGASQSNKEDYVIGHICRLPEETPAKQALHEATTDYKKKIGRPKLTWIKQIKNDLRELGVEADEDFGNIIALASDREGWRALCDLRKGRQLSVEE